MLPDFESIFRLDVNALELVVRTSIVYLGLLAALRIIGRRETGSLELPELLMVVLVADGVQNGMTAEYGSVTGAAIIAGTLLGWNFFLDWLAYVSPAAAKIIRPAPLPLVRDGRYQRKNMRREMVTQDEVESLLRAQGVDDAGQVKLAGLEPGGELSVIRKDAQEPQSASRKQKAV